MSEYTHGSEELNEKLQRYIEVPSEHAKGYKAGQEDIYIWVSGMVEDWYAMKVVNDGQMLWLKELLHEMEKNLYYTYNGENK